jgi:hypothetical protein
LGIWGELKGGLLEDIWGRKEGTTQAFEGMKWALVDEVGVREGFFLSFTM